MSRMSPPVPLVPRFVHGAHKLRKARGFSLGELKQAGLVKSQARSMKVRIDQRRSTIHAQNVTALKTFLTPTQTTVVPEPPMEAPAVLPEAKETPKPPTRTAKRSAKPTKKRQL